MNDRMTAWNTHDLERITRHYADNAEFTANTVVSRWNTEDRKLWKRRLHQHFAKGLSLAPDINVIAGTCQ